MLKSGGPPMTVLEVPLTEVEMAEEGLEDEEVDVYRCVFFDRKQRLRDEEFNGFALIRSTSLSSP